MIFRLLAILAFFQLSTAYGDARLIIHLTDYLANDYSGAVSEEGKVLSDGEYAEQIEFSQTALKDGKTDPTLNKDADLLTKIK